MEKLELHKKLQKQKAATIGLMLLTGLMTPTLLSMTSRFNFSLLQQFFVCTFLFAVMFILFKRMQKIESRLKYSV